MSSSVPLSLFGQDETWQLSAVLPWLERPPSLSLERSSTFHSHKPSLPSSRPPHRTPCLLDVAVPTPPAPADRPCLEQNRGETPQPHCHEREGGLAAPASPDRISSLTAGPRPQVCMPDSGHHLN